MSRAAPARIAGPYENCGARFELPSLRAVVVHEGG
jgi:hypothetical protein